MPQPSTPPENSAEQIAHSATTARALGRVLDLHGQCRNRCGLCHECGQQHPCRTARAAGVSA